MATKNLLRFYILGCFGLTYYAFSAVTLSSDFKNTGDKRNTVYNFWKVRNEIPGYPSVGSQQPPQYHKGYSSTDGSSWTQIGSDTVAMAADVYVGLCVTSHNDGTLSTAVFSDTETNGN